RRRTGSFETELVSTGIGTHGSPLGDLDGDGDLDILGVPFNWDVPREPPCAATFRPTRKRPRSPQLASRFPCGPRAATLVRALLLPRRLPLGPPRVASARAPASRTRAQGKPPKHATSPLALYLRAHSPSDLAAAISCVRRGSHRARRREGEREEIR